MAMSVIESYLRSVSLGDRPSSDLFFAPANIIRLSDESRESPLNQRERNAIASIAGLVAFRLFVVSAQEIAWVCLEGNEIDFTGFDSRSIAKNYLLLIDNVMTNS